MRPRIPFSFLMMLVLALSVAGVGCPCNSVINNSDGIRWWLFSNFGAQKICPEMLKHGVPLKLAPLGAASVGRFFPQQCRTTIDEASHTMQLYASGNGYVFLPVTRRIGFYAGLSVEYRPDFRLEDDALYVWGKFNRMLSMPDLRIVGVENSAVNLATQTPMGTVATLIGQGVMSSEIAKGFTAVRTDEGDDFALGEIRPPNKPQRPFKAGEGRQMLASDMSEIHAASREYLGPFVVEDSSAALYLRLRAAAAPMIYTVVDKAAGDAWLQTYEQAQLVGPPPGAPLLAYGEVPIGETSRTVPVRPGSYYVVVENRAQAPLSTLGVQLPFDSAYLTYAVEVGDRP